MQKWGAYAGKEDDDDTMHKGRERERGRQQWRGTQRRRQHLAPKRSKYRTAYKFVTCPTCSMYPLVGTYLFIKSPQERNIWRRWSLQLSQFVTDNPGRRCENRISNQGKFVWFSRKGRERHTPSSYYFEGECARGEGGFHSSNRGLRRHWVLHIQSSGFIPIIESVRNRGRSTFHRRTTDKDNL